MNHAEFSPDGQWLVTASDDKTAIIWFLKKCQPARALQGHTGPVRYACFSRDGRMIATASQDGSVCLWGEPPNGDDRRRLPRIIERTT